MSRWHLQPVNQTKHLLVEFLIVIVGYIQPSNPAFVTQSSGREQAGTYINLFIMRLSVYHCDQVKEHSNSQPDIHKSSNDHE